MDIKNVISGLEGLTWDDWRDYHSDSEVINIAREALELLETKKPGPQRYLHGDLFKLPLCPNENCNAVMTKEWHYCPYCGTPMEFDDALDRTMRKCVQSMLKG